MENRIIKINKEILEHWLYEATIKARRESKALGLSYKKVVDGEVIEVSPESEKVIKPSKYKKIKVEKKTYKLKK